MKMKFVALPILLAFPAHGASLLTLTNPVADGAINTTGGNNIRTDWDGITAFPGDPDEMNDNDFSTISLAHDINNFYLRQQMYRTDAGGFVSGNQIIVLDIDQDNTTGYRGPAGTYAVGGEYIIQGSNLFKWTGTTDQTAFSFGASTALVYDDFPINDHEFTLARSAIGSPTSFDFIGIIDYFGSSDLYPDTGNGGNTGGFYSYSTIPEPGSVFLGCAGLFALLTRRNRIL